MTKGFSDKQFSGHTNPGKLKNKAIQPLATRGVPADAPQPRILIVGSSSELDALNALNDKQQAPALRQCVPILTSFGEPAPASQGFYQHSDTYADIVELATDPQRKIDGVLMGHKRKDNGEEYGVELCKALKAGGFMGQMVVQTRVTKQAELLKLNVAVEEAGGLGAFHADKTHKASAFSGLATMNKVISYAGRAPGSASFMQ